MITTARGNLLEADVDALVSTVNTVGVMGKGIALQFKRASKAGDVTLGRMHVWETGSMSGRATSSTFRPRATGERRPSSVTSIAGLTTWSG